MRRTATRIVVVGRSDTQVRFGVELAVLLRTMLDDFLMEGLEEARHIDVDVDQTLLGLVIDEDKSTGVVGAAETSSHLLRF